LENIESDVRVDGNSLGFYFDSHSDWFEPVDQSNLVFNGLPHLGLLLEVRVRDNARVCISLKTLVSQELRLGLLMRWHDKESKSVGERLLEDEVAVP
jgi:hypothetical protein